MEIISQLYVPDALHPGSKHSAIEHLVFVYYYYHHHYHRDHHHLATYGIYFNSILLLWRYISDRVLAFSIISFHLRQFCTCSAHFISFIFFRSFLTSSSYRDLGLPAGLPASGFHLCILFTMPVLGILFMYPNQLNL